MAVRQPGRHSLFQLFEIKRLQVSRWLPFTHHASRKQTRGLYPLANNCSHWRIYPQAPKILSIVLMLVHQTSARCQKSFLSVVYDFWEWLNQLTSPNNMKFVFVVCLPLAEELCSATDVYTRQWWCLRSAGCFLFTANLSSVAQQSQLLFPFLSFFL